MISQTLKVAMIAAVIAIATPAAAQDCGCGISGGYGVTGDNCGREISQQQALGLWAGYCSESCGYNGGSSCSGCGLSGCRGGCKLFGKLRSRGGGCGCDFNTCFNYPISTGDCGAYTDIASGCGCRLGGKLRGLLSHHGCGGGCGLRGERGGCGLGNPCGSGCGGRLKGLLANCNLFGGGCGLFSRSRRACGCNGSYFSEAVGYEYGTAGIQSCVSGTVDSVMTPVMDSTPAAIGTSITPQDSAHGMPGSILVPAAEHVHSDDSGH